jgi:hypothetical protein
MSKTEALGTHAYGLRANKIAAGKGEIHVGPVD